MNLRLWIIAVLAILLAPRQARAMEYRMVASGYVIDFSSVLGDTIHLGDPVETILTYDPSLTLPVWSTPDDAIYYPTPDQGASMSMRVGPYMSTVDFVELPFLYVEIVDNRLVSPGPPEILQDYFYAEGTVSPSATNLPIADGLRMRFFIGELGYGTMPSLFQGVALPASSLDIASADVNGDIIGTQSDFVLAYRINSIQINPASIPEPPGLDLFLAGMLLLARHRFLRSSCR